MTLASPHHGITVSFDAKVPNAVCLSYIVHAEFTGEMKVFTTRTHPTYRRVALPIATILRFGPVPFHPHEISVTHAYCMVDFGALSKVLSSVSLQALTMLLVPTAQKMPRALAGDAATASELALRRGAESEAEHADILAAARHVDALFARQDDESALGAADAKVERVLHVFCAERGCAFFGLTTGFFSAPPAVKADRDAAHFDEGFPQALLPKECPSRCVIPFVAFASPGGVQNVYFPSPLAAAQSMIEPTRHRGHYIPEMSAEALAIAAVRLFERGVTNFNALEEVFSPSVTDHGPAQALVNKFKGQRHRGALSGAERAVSNAAADLQAASAINLDEEILSSLRANLEAAIARADRVESRLARRESLVGLRHLSSVISYWAKRFPRLALDIKRCTSGQDSACLYVEASGKFDGPARISGKTSTHKSFSAAFHFFAHVTDGRISRFLVDGEWGRLLGQIEVPVVLPDGLHGGMKRTLPLVDVTHHRSELVAREIRGANAAAALDSVMDLVSQCAAPGEHLQAFTDDIHKMLATSCLIAINSSFGDHRSARGYEAAELLVSVVKPFKYITVARRFATAMPGAVAAYYNAIGVISSDQGADLVAGMLQESDVDFLADIDFGIFVTARIDAHGRVVAAEVSVDGRTIAAQLNAARHSAVTSAVKKIMVPKIAVSPPAAQVEGEMHAPTAA